jgi:hypothetical protein
MIVAVAASVIDRRMRGARAHPESVVARTQPAADPRCHGTAVFRLGRLRGSHGPGLVLIIPLIECTRWVNLQVDTADIPARDLITKDNVTIRVEAAVFFRVVDPIGNHARGRPGT